VLCRAGIRAIFNLESPDEHVSCGHGNHSSGFSYDPSEFMEVGSKMKTSVNIHSLTECLIYFFSQFSFTTMPWKIMEP
jgi:hypothetical protein